MEASPRFREWYGSLAPESEKLPLGACHLYIIYVSIDPEDWLSDAAKHEHTMAEWAGLDRTPILKMLVVRCLRPDRSATRVDRKSVV